MADVVELQHVLPARVRFHMPGLKGDRARARELESILRRSAHVKRARANPVTGSVVIECDLSEGASLGEVVVDLVPQLDAEEVDRLAARAAEGILHLHHAAEHRAHGRRDWVGGIRAASRRVNDRVGDATGGADLRILVPVGFMACGVTRMATSSLVLPRWYEYFWFAFHTFNAYSSSADWPGSGPDGGVPPAAGGADAS